MPLQHNSRPVVAHIVSELRPGGVEMRTYELLKHLGEGSERHIVLSMSGRKGPLAGLYESLPVPVFACNMRTPSFPFMFLRLLRKESVTVVHSNIHYSSGYLLTLARLAGIRNRICHFRSDGPKKRGKITTLKNEILRWLISRSATSIVGVSPSALDGSWSTSWMSDPRCAVVQNGLNLSEFEAVEPLDLADEFKFQGNHRPVIVHVGRADIPTKNREKAIQVFSALLTQRPKAVLLFVGRNGKNSAQVSDNLARWSKLAKELHVEKNVFYAGERNDVKQILTAADCLLMTSTLEGLPGVLLEAAAVGVPSVSTALPGARFIQRTVRSIRLLDANDSDEEWADAIMGSIASVEEGDITRQGIRQMLVGSPFDLNVSLQGYVKLWNLRR